MHTESIDPNFEIRAMEPTVKSILGCVVKSWACIPNSTRVDRASADLFFENVSRTLLNWLNRGENAELKDLREGIGRSIGRTPGCVDFLESLTTEQLMLVRMVAVQDILHAYTFTFNSLDLSRLLGKRRKAWRDALVALLVAQESLAVTAFLEGSFPFAEYNTAHAAFVKMQANGYVELSKRESRIYVSLTADGKSAALRFAEMERRNLEPRADTGSKTEVADMGENNTERRFDPKRNPSILSRERALRNHSKNAEDAGLKPLNKVMLAFRNPKATD